MNHKFKYITVLALFVLAGALTFFCRVERHAQAKAINLAAIPTTVGEWRMVSQNAAVGAKEGKFLDDVLVRTYQRPDGKEVMLAIAYGADQRKNFSIHLPEVCYKDSGCTVTSVGHATMDTPRLNLKQMLAKNPDGRLEAVQYWITLDGKVVTSDFERKLKHAYYGFFGAEAGGVLVRVSSFVTDGEYKKNLEEQKTFVYSLYQNINSELRSQLYGIF